MSDPRRLTDYFGRSEGPDLEFKSAECLKDPRIISRAVCGFLNAKGGEVIIGIREEGSGLALSPIPEPEKARKFVRDYLLSTIEPKAICPTDLLDGGGIRISVPEGKELHVTREKNGAFAVYLRVDDRLVPLGWNEVVQRLGRQRHDVRRQGENGDEQTLELLQKWQESALSKSPPLKDPGGIFLYLRPSTSLNLTEDRWEKIQAWIEDPTLVGIRRMGWHYSSRKGKLTLVQGDLGWRRSGDQAEGFRWLEVSRNGNLRFATRLGEDIFWIQKHDEVKSLYPYALCETIASCATLFAKVIEEANAGGDVWAAVGLTGIRGISLGPFRPNAFDYENLSSWREPYPADSLPPIVDSEGRTEFIKNPHLLAWSLVRQVYACFGYKEEAVPFYNPETARFTFE